MKYLQSISLLIFRISFIVSQSFVNFTFNAILELICITCIKLELN